MLVFLLTHVYHILNMLQYACISSYSCLSHSRYVAVCLYFFLLMSITLSICCQYACISSYSCLSHSQYVASTLVFLLTHVYHILDMLQYACISAYSCLSHSQYVASTLVFLLTHVYHILSMLPVCLYFFILMFITFSVCCQYACISAYSCLSHSQYVASMLVFLLTHVYHILDMLQYACISAYSCLSHSQYVASTLVFLLTHVYHILSMLPVRLYFCLLMSITFSVCCQYACISAYSCLSHSQYVASMLVFLLTHVYHILSMLPVCLYFCLLMSITFSVSMLPVCLYFCLLMSITFSVCCQYACISAY